MSGTPVSDLGRPVEGVLWMLATGLCFVGVTGVVRYLGTDLPAAQSAFLRFAFGVVFLLPAIAPLLRTRLAPGLWPMIAGRGVVHTAAVVLWFYAMARIPVAEVTAIGYLNPVLVMLGAAVLFAEGLNRRRVLTVLVALVGAVIVLRPGLRELSSGHLAQLAAAVCFAASYLVAKHLGARMGAGAVVALMSLTVTLGLAPFALWAWVPVSTEQLLWLAGLAVLATVAHYCMMRAFAAAPLAVTQPVTFLQLVWATLLGALVFGEAVDVWVLAGGAVIIGAISVNAVLEARSTRTDETPPQPDV